MGLEPKGWLQTSHQIRQILTTLQHYFHFFPYVLLELFILFCWSQGYTAHPSSGHNTSGSQSMDSGQIGGSLGRGGTLGRGGNRGSIASVGKPSSSTLASLAGLLSATESGTKAESSFSQGVYKREDRETDPAENNLAGDKEPVFQRVRVSMVTEPTPLRIMLKWLVQ
jgi:hypothetical protein